MNIFKSIGGFFKRVFGSEQNWEKAISVTLAVATPLVSTLLTLTTGPGVSAEVLGIIGKIQLGLKSVNDIVVSTGPTPDLTSTLNGLLSNLQELEAAAQIKDPTHQEAVTVITQTLIGEIESIIAVLPTVKVQA